jgi:hypothetical protein
LIGLEGSPLAACEAETPKPRAQNFLLENANAQRLGAIWIGMYESTNAIAQNSRQFIDR